MAVDAGSFSQINTNEKINKVSTIKKELLINIIIKK